MLLRLYEPTEGEILLNGVNIKQYSYEQYSNLFSVMFQDSFELPYSIRENIILGMDQENERTDRLKQLLEKVLLRNKVESLPNKEDTPLLCNMNDGAVELSGGERQKLMMLRCMFKEAAFYIFDEPNSALSPAAEFEIKNNIYHFLETKTSIIIAHRLGFVRRCNRIWVISHGRIVEEGNHEELIARRGRYAEMYLSQAQD